MNFSLSTVLNTLIGSSLFAVIAVLLICRCATNRRIKLYTVFFLCAAAMLRLFLPFEFSFTHSFYIPNLWYGLHAMQLFLPAKWCKKIHGVPSFLKVYSVVSDSGSSASAGMIPRSAVSATDCSSDNMASNSARSVVIICCSS